MSQHTTILGTPLPASNAGARDAIHLAVIAVIAGMAMRSGAHVAVVDGYAYEATTELPATGVLDPFIPMEEDTYGANIPKGACVWLCLFPQTITSLTHSWEHPAFPRATQENLVITAKEVARSMITQMAASMGVTFDFLMTAAANNVNTGDYTSMGSNESYSNVDWPEFWKYYQAYTGQPLPEDHERKWGFFSCAC